MTGIDVPFLQRAFNLQMQNMKGWIFALVLGLIPLILNEFLKLFFWIFNTCVFIDKAGCRAETDR